MALKIYEDTDATAYSVDGLYTNPLFLTFDGRLGGSLAKKLYLRNDDNTVTYTVIQIDVEQVGGNINYIDSESTNGFSIKLHAGDIEPTADEWNTGIAAGGAIDMDDIPDTVTYLPFWIRVKIPPRVPVQHINKIRFLITATEND